MTDTDKLQPLGRFKSANRLEDNDDFSYCSTTDAKTRMDFLMNDDFVTNAV